jgi:hypothetical protein
MPSQRIIALYDANRHGHHTTYLRLFSKQFLEMGYETWLFCQDPEEIARWVSDKCNADAARRLVCFAIAPLPKTSIFNWWTLGAFNWLRSAREIEHAVVAKRERPDLVFFLKLDDFSKGILSTTFLDYVVRFDWAGMIIHLRFPVSFGPRRVIDGICRPLSIYRSKYCKGVGILQEDRDAMLRQRTKKRIVIFPDITDHAKPLQTKLTERIMCAAKGRTIIGLIGGQDRRKGSFDILNVARACQNRDWFFLLVGKMNHPKSDAELNRLQNMIADRGKWTNCFFHFSSIPNEGEFNAIIDLCDIIFAVYRNFPFSSNIMTKAALFKKPILVAKGGLMAKRLRRDPFGLECQPGNTQEIVDNIDALTKMSIPAAVFKRYAKKHSPAEFSSAISLLTHEAVLD